MKNIMKETFIAITLLAISSSSYAQSAACAPCGEVITNADMPADAPNLMPYQNYIATASTGCRNPNNYFGGFYAGAAYGLGVTTFHPEVGISPVGLDSSSRSYLGALINAGFDLVLNYFSLGVEVGYDHRSRNDPISYFDMVDVLAISREFLVPFVIATPSKVRFDINSQHSGTVDILPGFVYSRFTAYLRLGVDQSKYQLQRRVSFPAVTFSEDIFTGGLDALVEDEQFVFTSKSKNVTGFRLGLGFGVAATRHISFHLNYIHTFTHNQSFTPTVSDILAAAPELIPPEAGDLVANELGQLASNITIEPQRDELNFGVRFTF